MIVHRWIHQKVDCKYWVHIISHFLASNWNLDKHQDPEILLFRWTSFSGKSKGKSNFRWLFCSCFSPRCQFFSGLEKKKNYEHKPPVMALEVHLENYIWLTMSFLLFYFFKCLKIFDLLFCVANSLKKNYTLTVFCSH